MAKPDKALGRQPPIEVRRQLRSEVGFGCPAPGCGSPFLQYHHFDPEWSEEQHHRPEGMIALCPTHHGTHAGFTHDELREMKQTAVAAPVSAKFNWLREDLVGWVGGNLYIDCPQLVLWCGEPMVWFARDRQNRALLNFRMLSEVANQNSRMKVVDNDFLVSGSPEDMECPNHGRLVDVRYENGDRVRIEFLGEKNLTQAAIHRLKFESMAPLLPEGSTLVAITFVAAGAGLIAEPHQTTFGGKHLFAGNVSIGSGGANFVM